MFSPKNLITRRNVNDAEIIEVFRADQSNEYWKQFINEYSTPVSICGYIASAVAFHLATQFPFFEMNKETLQEMIDSVSIHNIEATVTQLMRNLEQDRRNYLSSHKKTANEEMKYLSNWVANYEIGDWIANNAGLTRNVQFLRCIERNDVHDEELERCQVEDFLFSDHEIFIESVPPFNKEHQEGGIESAVKPLPGWAAGFAKTRLFSASQWLQFYYPSSHHDGVNIDAALQELSPTFVVDGLGHFVAAKPIVLCDENGNRKKCLIVFNSINGPTSSKSMFTLLTKLIYHAKSEENDSEFVHP